MGELVIENCSYFKFSIYTLRKLRNQLLPKMNLDHITKSKSRIFYIVYEIITKTYTIKVQKTLVWDG